MTFPLAFVIGFSVASIPGPTIILIASETLRKGAGAGLSVMTAPLLLDALLMLPLGLFFQALLPVESGRTGLMIIGGGLLVWFGLQSIRTGPDEKSAAAKLDSPALDGRRETRPFSKGILVHLTSPYPYLYWGTVGAPLVRQGFESGGLWTAAIFPLGFWVGTTSFTLVVIALLARGKKLLSPPWQLFFHRALGALLIATGVFLMMKGWQDISG